MNFESILKVTKHFVLESHELTPELNEKILDMNLGAQVVEFFLNSQL